MDRSRKFSRAGTRLVAALAVAVVAGGAPLVAQTAGTDNRDGSYVNFEEAPVHPLELVTNPNELWLANVAGGTVSVFSLPTLALVTEIPVGLGPVTIRQRPGTNEMWVVCQSSGSVFIVDRVSRKVVDSLMPGAFVNGVEIGSEPCGLVFDAGGTTAWCTLSVVNQIAEINAGFRSVTKRIEFGTPFPDPTSPLVHAEEPRSLLVDGNTLYALSLESGNGTTANASLFVSTMVDMWALRATNNTPPPPDRDLLVFDLTGGSPNGRTALWRMGTLDFDVKIRPGSSPANFYVSNTDANNQLVGEFQFPLNGIVKNRVSHATISATVPQATTHVDLNDPAFRVPGLPATAHFGMPNEMQFSADGTKLYVCCYETRTTAVIDATTDKVFASLASGGYGPRGLALDATGQVLYVYNRADATLDAFNVGNISPGAVVAPALHVSAGYDPTPPMVRLGRLQHINADNSSNKLQSCNTCHLDGHTDRIAWNLGQFTGDLPNHPVAKDPKGIKVTQSLRNIEETAPYHWRGDRADLDAFKPAFNALLGGTIPSNADFNTFQAFVFSLAMPSNPRQLPDRTLTVAPVSPNATDGKNLFQTFPVLAVSTDTVAPTHDRTLKCVDCHRLDNFSGTTGQVFNDVTTPPSFFDNPANLRGLFDKDADDVDYGSAFNLVGGVALGGLNRTVATGWGTANNGFGDAVKDFVPSVFAALSPADALSITQFVLEFDSGTGPATAYGYTLTPAKAASLPTVPVMSYLVPQALAGNCDLAVRGVLSNGTPVGMLFDVVSQAFVSDHATLGSFTYSQILQLAIVGGKFSFIGVPVGSGRRVGIDRDLDFLSDGDETATSPTIADSDGDLFPDGYEVAHGSNPIDPLSVPVNGVAPTIFNDQLVFSSSVLAKFRWETTGEASTRVTVTDSATGALVGTFFDRRFERHHVIVVRKLEAEHAYSATLDGLDPNGNVVPGVVRQISSQRNEFQSIRSKNVTLAITGFNPNHTAQLLATFVVEGEIHELKQNANVFGRIVEWLPGQAATVTSFSTAATNSAGTTTLAFNSTNVAGASATVEVIVDDITDLANELHFHPLEVTFSAKTTF